MKNFFTSMLGSLAALVIFVVGALILFVGVLGFLAALGTKKPVALERGSYLVFDLDVNITDAPPMADGAALLAALTGGDNGPETLQLRRITHALQAAAKDPRIAGVLLTGHLSPFGADNGFATLQEVRNALGAIKAAGKPVVAYLELADTRDMYVASIADELVLDPYGMVAMPGLASEPIFYAGAFEKFGVGVQVTRVGRFKAFVEPFTRKDMSPENREQMQKLLGDLWGTLLAETAAARGLEPAALQALIDSEGYIRAEPALKAGLVSRVAYRDEVIAELKKRTGRENSTRSFKQIALSDYLDAQDDGLVVKEDTNDDDASEQHGGSPGRIAVVYAEGAIVDGDGESGEVGGVKFARELRRLRQDDDVKAIVLRVNSPGGSASASEHIQREIRLARQTKPVVVSMGSYAASGGYWISAYGDKIFAEPTTITGSIGVFGIQFNIQKLANDLGFTFDRVQTGKFAALSSIARPKTEEELAVFQRLVDWIYGEFVTKVADGRGLERADVEEIAEGRVWSGTEAQKLGLVDEVGGLDDAIRYAAERAGLGKRYRLVEFPAKKDLRELIAEALEGFKPMSSRMGAVSGLIETVRTEAKSLEQFNDARGVYARLPFDIHLK